MTRELFILLLLLIQIACTLTKRCPESSPTRKVVNTCPRNLQEYKERAKERRCESISNSCDSFVYHCVPDTYLTLLQEICAPKTVIVGGKCAEWNIKGQSIQSSKNSRGLCWDFESNPCPDVYFSTDLYKYPGCYDLIQIISHEETTTATKATTTDKYIPQPESNPIWKTAIIITVLVIIIVSAITIAFKRRVCLRWFDSRSTQDGRDRKTDNNNCAEEEGLLNNDMQGHSDHEINEDDGEDKGTIEISLTDRKKVGVDSNFHDNEYHNKARKRRGRKRYLSESSAAESDESYKDVEYQKLIKDASNLQGQTSTKDITNTRRLSSVEEEDTYSKKMIMSSLDTYEKARAFHRKFPQRKRRITA